MVSESDPILHANHLGSQDKSIFQSFELYLCKSVIHYYIDKLSDGIKNPAL